MATRSLPIVLVVHDDNQVLRQIAKMTSEIIELVCSRRAAHANAILDQMARIDVVLVGRCGDGVSPLDVLGAARAKQKQARMVLLAEATDLSTPIEALHGGLVDHILNPPLRERELRAILTMPAKPLVNPSAFTSVSPPARRPV